MALGIRVNNRIPEFQDGSVLKGPQWVTGATSLLQQGHPRAGGMCPDNSGNSTSSWSLLKAWTLPMEEVLSPVQVEFLGSVPSHSLSHGWAPGAEPGPCSADVS